MAKKWLVVLTAVVVLLIGASVVIAEMRSMEKHHMEMGESSCMPCELQGNAWFYLDNKEALGLNEEQEAKLKTLQRETKKIKIKNMAEVDVLMLDINAILDEKKPNLSDINAKIDRCSQLKADTMKTCIQSLVKAKEILTEEQIKIAQGLTKTCDMGKMSKGHHEMEEGHGK